MHVRSETARVLITVKASPQPSAKYGDTVCVAGIRVGGITAGLGALLGGRQGSAQNNAAAGLTPLPPIVLREGRVFLGPLRLPLQPLRPLY